MNAESNYTLFTETSGRHITVHAGDVLERGTRIGNTCSLDRPIGVGASMPDGWIGNGPIITVGFDSRCRATIKNVRVPR